MLQKGELQLFSIAKRSVPSYQTDLEEMVLEVWKKTTMVLRSSTESFQWKTHSSIDFGMEGGTPPDRQNFYPFFKGHFGRKGYPFSGFWKCLLGHKNRPMFGISCKNYPIKAAHPRYTFM